MNVIATLQESENGSRSPPRGTGHGVDENSLDRSASHSGASNQGRPACVINYAIKKSNSTGTPNASYINTSNVSAGSTSQNPESIVPFLTPNEGLNDQKRRLEDSVYSQAGGVDAEKKEREWLLDVQSRLSSNPNDGVSSQLSKLPSTSPAASQVTHEHSSAPAAQIHEATKVSVEEISARFAAMMKDADLGDTSVSILLPSGSSAPATPLPAPPPPATIEAGLDNAEHADLSEESYHRGEERPLVADGIDDSATATNMKEGTNERAMAKASSVDNGTSLFSQRDINSSVTVREYVSITSVLVDYPIPPPPAWPSGGGFNAAGDLAAAANASASATAERVASSSPPSLFALAEGSLPSSPVPDDGVVDVVPSADAGTGASVGECDDLGAGGGTWRSLSDFVGVYHHCADLRSDNTSAVS